MLDTMVGSLPTVIAAAAIDVDGTVLVQMVVFLGVVVFLHYILFRPYLRTLEAREEGVHGSKEEASEMDAQAALLIEDYENKMRQARRDAAEVRESLRTQALQETTDDFGEVRAELDAKLTEERARIAAKVDAARIEMADRSKALAEVMVNKILPAA